MSDDASVPEIKSTKHTTNRYELIMVAAREARRLNDIYRIRNVEPKSRVTTEAIRRTRTGEILYSFGDPEGPSDDELGEDSGGTAIAE